MRKSIERRDYSIESEDNELVTRTYEVKKIKLKLSEKDELSGESVRKCSQNDEKNDEKCLNDENSARSFHSSRIFSKKFRQIGQFVRQKVLRNSPKTSLLARVV